MKDKRLENVPLNSSHEYVTEGFLTTQNRVVVRNAKLCDIIPLSGVLDGSWVPDRPQAKPQHIVRQKSSQQQEKREDENDLMLFQLQARCVDCLKCVRVVLEQIGQDVAARVDSAAWANPDSTEIPDYGYDFSTEKSADVQIVTSAADEGYGVSKLALLNVDAWLGHIRVALESDDEGKRVRVTLKAPTAVDISDVGVGLHWLNDDNSYGGWFLDKAPSFVKGSDSELEAVFTSADFKIPPGVKNLFPVVFFAPNQVYDKAWFKTEKEDAIERNLVLDVDSLEEQIDKHTIGSRRGDIFISYSRADIEKVRPVVAAIRKYTGIDPWIDVTGIETGSQFEDVIIDAIDRCKVFVFLMSKNALDSPWTRREVNYAFNEGKKVCPVRIDGAKPAKWFRFKYEGIDSVDYSDAIQREKLFRNLKEWTNGDGRQHDVERQRGIVEGKIEKAKIEQRRAEEELSALQKNYQTQMAAAEAEVKESSNEVARLKAELNDARCRHEVAQAQREKLSTEHEVRCKMLHDRIAMLHGSVTTLEAELKAI